MPRIIMDGYHKVWSVPTIANIAAPTTAELNAGLNLGTDLLSKTGVQGFEPDTAEVDTSAMGSLYETKEPGLMGLAKGGLEFLANPQATEIIRPVFIRGFTTNIVIRRNGKLDTAAWASTDWLEVWPIKCGARKDGTFASNETQKFIIEVFFYIQPNQNAVVA